MNKYNLSKTDYAIKIVLAICIPIGGCTLLFALILGIAQIVGWGFGQFTRF